MKRLVALALALCFLLGAFTGCGGEPSNVTPVKDTLVAMSTFTDYTLDPTSGGLMDHLVLPALYDTLCRIGPTGEILPLLAESFERTEDGRGFIFHLNPEAKFHDGSKVTADDVVYSINVKLEKPQFNNMQVTIGEYESVDDETVIIYGATPFSNLIELLSHHIYILPKAAHEPDPIAFAENPVGSGPFKFISQDVDATLNLEAFEDYYEKKPVFKNLIIKQKLDPSTAVVALENGEVDLIPSVPPAQAKILSGDAAINHVNGMAVSCTLLVMMGDTLKNDINLRKAIYYAINRESAIAIANEGIGDPPTSPFASTSMREFLDVVTVEGHDLEKAKAYLEQSNYNGEELVMTTAVMASVAPTIQADLKAIGINMRIEQVDQNTWITRLRNGELEMTMANFGGLRSMGENLQFFEFSGRYYGLYTERDPVFEDLMNQIYQEYDSEKRYDLLVDALEAFIDSYSTVNVFDVTSNYSFSKEITYDYPISAGLEKYYLNYVEPA